ncbi:RsmB/NOP family class I SAM-dependent RNA methyltransferase [Agromyces archimandritae]|uniref:rRNA small subunit methyltransferase B n=1 Tax=Agromyces archimandritae TaxID=2781962 RepID=A0A975FM34_9MICO|nr:transcription antitermination factor NusB [Agromyces archimandritae]QTX04629.1 rRNA small subunit methyltransferase B [Agromyces archimandritae]
MSGQARRPARRRDPRPPQTRIARSRLVAFDVLEAVRDGEAYANLLLPTRIRRAGLDTADAAFATELAYGTLRMQGFYDRVIEQAAGRAASEIDPTVLVVLRLGVHQILAMRVPDHAAVNEQVALARKVAGPAAGFVNAVLRRVARTGAEEWRERIASAERDEDGRLSALTSHPEWIVRAFRAALEHEGRAGELEALLDADDTAPRVNLAILPGLGEQAAADAGVEPDRYSPIGATAEDPIRLAEASGGRIRVQDEGSQLAALALSRAEPIRPGERWLDLCAGPGGKAAVLAAEALAGGATLVANEAVPARAELVRKALVGIPAEVEVRVGDGRAIDAGGTEAGFDRILLDAPCTGLGALRRRPEARWRKRPADVPELTKLQGELLDAAIGALKPGGILAYVTCSPHTAETFGSLGAALARHAGSVEQLETRSVVQGVSRHPLDLAGGAETVQLWPHRHGTDAMFIALLRRTR